MIARIILSTAIVLATHPAIACPPQSASCNVQRVVNHHAANVQQVYAAPQQAVVNYGHAQQAVVNYGHAYNQQAVVLKQVYVPQYYSVGAQLEEEALAERIVRKALQSLDRKLSAAAGDHDRRDDRGQFEEHPGLKLAQAKCATCHAKGSASVSEGKSPWLFTELGEFVGTPEQAVAAVDAARGGRMPPKGPPLVDDDYFALKAYLTVASSAIEKQ